MFVAVYGSLRNKEYNFRRFEKYFPKGIKFLETYMIPGFELYDLGSYPGIKESNKDQLLTVDIMDCSWDCYKAIENMELGAGYVAKKVTIEDKDCVIFIYLGNPTKKVDSGDWSSYLKAKQQEIVYV